jgi:dephospho-CoA kinase
MDIQSNKPRIVGLTGGIGSGKSTARKIFEECGVPCIDADKVARDIHQDPAHPATDEIARAIPEAMASDGTLSRGSLRKIVIMDQEANNKLKRILKPYVMQNLLQWTHAQSAPYVIWESALLIEEEIDTDRLLAVVASDATRIARIQTRNPDWSLDQIKRILTIQLSNTEYEAKADDVLHNDGSEESLRSKIESLHAAYLKQWS